MKIIIIGGGIAGLTMGLACIQAGFEIKIYEKTKALQNIGGGILLWPHGLRYLKSLGIVDCLKPYYVPVNKCTTVDHGGNYLGIEDCSSFLKILGGNILPLDRSQLQTALLNQLPPHCIQLGKECVSIKNTKERAYIKFKDGTEDSADLIVGADGIHSNVRKALRNHDALTYSGLCWWGGIIETRYLPTFKYDESSLILGVRKTCIVWPISDNKFMWYLCVKMPATDLSQQKDGLIQLQEICADWNDAVKHIIKPEKNEKTFHLAIHTLPPQRSVAHHRIILIGDAAHGLGPVLAQGTSLAIEDVFILVNYLKNMNDDVPTTIKNYESQRLSRYKIFYDLENGAEKIIVADNQEILVLMEDQMKKIDLITMYKDLIPLINENAFQQIATIPAVVYS